MKFGAFSERLRWALTLLWVIGMGLQTYMLYAHFGNEGGGVSGLDFAVHAMMFGCPAALALILGWQYVPILLAWYAPVSELIQGLPSIHRDPDLHDAVADITGILVLGALVEIAKRRSIR